MCTYTVIFICLSAFEYLIELNAHFVENVNLLMF